MYVQGIMWPLIKGLPYIQLYSFNLANSCQTCDVLAVSCQKTQYVQSTEPCPARIISLKHVLNLKVIHHVTTVG